MSWQENLTPDCHESHHRTVQLTIEPKTKDIGGFDVRRVLPSPRCRSVGPFVFFDEMGPAQFGPDQGIEVRPHPHIGLATITYLFDGEIMHRDSLGVEQAIRPGAINWMTAGRGIVHSERTPHALRDRTKRLHGIQSWLALPQAHEEVDPEFHHYPADTLPRFERDGARVRLLVGEAFGERSPVATYSETLYLDVLLEAGAQLELPAGARERAIYLVEGEVELSNHRLAPATMTLLGDNPDLTLSASATHPSASRLVIIGGEPLGARYLWWNFVSSAKERIERAKQDWRAGHFARVPSEPEEEFIPLPEN